MLVRCYADLSKPFCGDEMLAHDEDLVLAVATPGHDCSSRGHDDGRFTLRSFNLLAAKGPAARLDCGGVGREHHQPVFVDDNWG